MLVLSRKVGERVVIGDGIVVQVLDLKGKRIRLGIEAPAEIGVWREELSEPSEPTSSVQSVIGKPR